MKYRVVKSTLIWLKGIGHRAHTYNRGLEIVPIDHRHLTSYLHPLTLALCPYTCHLCPPTSDLSPLTFDLSP